MGFGAESPGWCWGAWPPACCSWPASPCSWCARRGRPRWTSPVPGPRQKRVLHELLSWGGVLLVIGGPGAVPGTPQQIERLS